MNNKIIIIKKETHNKVSLPAIAFQPMGQCLFALLTQVSILAPKLVTASKWPRRG
jgi:hypothetical protein